jgi:H+-transporting ATPase
VPNVWRIGSVTAAAGALGLAKLAFSSGVLLVGRYGLDFGIDTLRTLAFITLAFGSQAAIYAIRERSRLWSSRPSSWIILSSILDLGIASTVALGGGLTPALPISVVASVFASAVIFAIMLDLMKVPIFSLLKIN